MSMASMPRRLRVLLGFVVLAAALLLALSLGPPAHAAKRKFKTYTVQPGDSVWSIAEEFYGSGDKYKLIYKYNPFAGVPPHILVPGQVLKLPIGAISPEAQVDWMQKEVKAKPPRSLDWLSASKKMNLWKLYKVSTGDESAVHIVFEDSSDLRLRDNALLVIYGGDAGSAKKKKKRRQKTRVMLERGTLRGGLAAMDAAVGASAPAAATESGSGSESGLADGSSTSGAGGMSSADGSSTSGDDLGGRSMIVETPSGRVELASSSSQVTATATTSSVSVYHGTAKVSGGGRTVKVKKGFGTVVKKGKKPAKPRPLPAPPAWSIGTGAGDGDAVAIVPAGGRANFQAAWSVVKGAVEYRVELAHDAAFKRIAVDTKVGAETTRFHLDNIPPGQYFARISARDSIGLEGQPSSSLALNVVGIHSSRRLQRAPQNAAEVAAEDAPEAARGWEVAGLSRLELGASGQGLEWALDDGPFIDGTEPARVQGVGQHVIKVRRAGKTLETSFALKVLRVDAAIDVSMDAGPIPAGGQGRQLNLVITDEHGRPASLPGVSIVTPNADTAAVKLTETGPGAWTGTLPAPAPPGPEELTVQARWLGGALASVTLPVAQKFPPVPYQYKWRRVAHGLPWDGRLAATPLPSVVAVDRLSAQVAAFKHSDESFLGVTLQGELALADGRLGLDAALTLFRPPLQSDATVTNELGDAIFGVRYVAFESPRFLLAPSLRTRLALRDRRETRFWGAEPTVLLRWWASRTVWLESRQGVLVAFNGKKSAKVPAGADVSYVGDYSLVWGATSAFSLNVQLDSAFTLTSPIDGLETAAFAAGLGLQLTVKRVRFGLNAGFGLGDGGKQRFGDATGALTIDFGFGTP